MNDIVLNLLAIGGFLVIAGIIVLSVNKKQKQEEQNITFLAQQKGWQIERILEPLAKGNRITATNWSLETISRYSGMQVGPGSTDMEQKTTWFSSQPGSTILIGTRMTQASLGPAAEMLKKQIIQAALGKEAEGIKEVEIGSSAFAKQFMVWAQDINDAEKLITPAMQSALLTWMKVPPLIKRTSKGVTIELRGVYLKKIDDLERIIELGKHFL